MSEDIRPGAIVRDKDIRWLRGRVIDRGSIPYGCRRIEGYLVVYFTGHEAGRMGFMPEDDIEEVFR